MDKQWGDDRDASEADLTGEPIAEMDELVEGFARAIFVSAWASACGEITGEPGDDSIDCYDCGAKGVGSSYDAEDHDDDCEAYALAREHSPGPQEDWMDYAPETTEHARKVARVTLDAIAQRNGLGDSAALLAIYSRNAALPGHDAEPTITDFGHYLGMQWLGCGVCWADSHPDHDLECGYGEYAITDLRDPEGSAYPQAV